MKVTFNYIACLIFCALLGCVGCNKKEDKDTTITITVPAADRTPSQIKAAQVRLMAFSTALDMFAVDNGHYPATGDGLNALVQNPSGLKNWHQYLDAVPKDPWGNPFIYKFPGTHRTNSYDLSSAGPDGRPGTSDDITNW